MSPTRTMPIPGAQNKINIVIDSFIAPDRNIELDENFVRERLYSDEKLQLSENSDNNESPNIKPKVTEKISSTSSNPDLDDEFAFNKNWGKHQKFGAMPPPNEIFRQSTINHPKPSQPRIQRRSQSEEKDFHSKTPLQFFGTEYKKDSPILADHPNTTKDNNVLIGQKRIIDTHTG